MKRIGYLFDKVFSFDNLQEAFKKAFRGTGRTEEACRFHFHLEKELLQLKRELESKTYRPAPYRYFKIFDPKERTISVAPFRDRVVHHAVVRVLEPVFDKSFIYDSYATRKGKGTHRAVLRAQAFLRKNTWYLKTDVSKYFGSISHDVLLALIAGKIKDKNLLDLVEHIVRNADRNQDRLAGRGLPIGNLTSQFFANVYLDPLDHFVKEQMKVKYYIRYMAAMVFFFGLKEDLRRWLKAVEEYLADSLKLRLKDKATLVNRKAHGLPFLGFRIFPAIIRVKQESLKRMKVRVRKREGAFENGLISEDQLTMSVRSMVEHISFADSFRLRQRMVQYGVGVI